MSIENKTINFVSSLATLKAEVDHIIDVLPTEDFRFEEDISNFVETVDACLSATEDFVDAIESV